MGSNTSDDTPKTESEIAAEQDRLACHLGHDLNETKSAINVYHQIIDRPIPGPQFGSYYRGVKGGNALTVLLHGGRTGTIETYASDIKETYTEKDPDYREKPPHYESCEEFASREIRGANKYGNMDRALAEVIQKYGIEDVFHPFVLEKPKAGWMADEKLPVLKDPEVSEPGYLDRFKSAVSGLFK